MHAAEARPFTRSAPPLIQMPGDGPQLVVAVLAQLIALWVLLAPMAGEAAEDWVDRLTGADRIAATETVAPEMAVWPTPPIPLE